MLTEKIVYSLKLQGEMKKTSNELKKSIDLIGLIFFD